MELSDILATIPLFEGQTKDCLNDLASISAVKSYHRGKTIFSEGDAGNGFYIVLEGRVKIFKLSPEGKEQILHILWPGEPFGEVAVFSGINFPAYAVALDTCKALFIPKEAFIRLITENPAITLNMMAMLSLRLRKFAAMIENLSLKEVPGRLATYLLMLSTREKGQAVFDLDMTKGQLASLLGTIPETLSRIFGRLAREKLIRIDGARVEILDRQGLKELAGVTNDG